MSDVPGELKPASQARASVTDLSKLDFEALRSRFKESKHQTTDLEVLKAAIRAMLERLISLNKIRADVAEMFEAMIESNNATSART